MINTRPRRRGVLWTERRDAYLYLLPWMIGFVLFTAGPMLGSLYISFTRWEIVTPAVWVGLDQYRRLFADDRFYLSLSGTRHIMSFWVCPCI